jgi:hypothetical protein
MLKQCNGLPKVPVLNDLDFGETVVFDLDKRTFDKDRTGLPFDVWFRIRVKGSPLSEVSRVEYWFAERRIKPEAS